MEYLIKVDDGNTFCGNLIHWGDCFFSFSDDETDEEKIDEITHWCAAHSYKLEINDKLVVSSIGVGDWVRVSGVGIGEIVAVDLTRREDYYEICMVDLDGGMWTDWYPETFIREVRKSNK
jgi:hypothetical protein